MLRYELFRFIAFKLEKVGEPVGDTPTLYGITRKYYPEQYELIKKAIERGNYSDLYNTVMSVYEYIYKNSIAIKFSDYFPLNFNVFDMAFNKGPDDAIICWQMTYNDISNNDIVESGEWDDETENTLGILKVYNAWNLNDYYSYNRQIRYMTSTKNSNWVEGLVYRVIRLQKFIMSLKNKGGRC